MKIKQNHLILALLLIAATAPARSQFTATLTWPPSENPNIAGYNIYRSGPQTAWEFQKINTCPITTATYTDRIDLRDEHIFYAISEVDFSHNETSPSHPVLITTGAEFSSIKGPTPNVTLTRDKQAPPPPTAAPASTVAPTLRPSPATPPTIAEKQIAAITQGFRAIIVPLIALILFLAALIITFIRKIDS
jgi:hypothetical protein